MSPFWKSFENNSKVRPLPVNTLREALSEACEDFAFVALPTGVKRNALLKELNRLIIHYRDSNNWPEV
ncbi:MAG: hypothetical protein K2R98_12695 [Gemmataceae bacterium]|nr:hypothetical protein [Gemmataceae bacterium]